VTIVKLKDDGSDLITDVTNSLNCEDWERGERVLFS
jgi:hypothetical protein